MHYEKSIRWLEQLFSVTDKQWRTPIKQGKWTVAEVIGHFIPWDDFVINERMPLLFTDELLAKGPNVQQMNAAAASSSRQQSKEHTLQALLNRRRVLLQLLDGLSDEQWQRSFRIGTSELTLYSYFAGLIAHDEHHFLQVQHVIDEIVWQ